MKHIKLFVLAAGAAMALMALAGAGTASATALCNANEVTCSAGHTYAIGTNIHAVLEEGQTAQLSGGPVSDTCEESTMTIKTTKAGTPLISSISQLTFNSCDCTTTTSVHLPFLGAWARTTTGNGTITASTGGTGNPGLTVTCAGLHCVYESASASMVITGGNPATISLNLGLNLNTGLSDFLCIFGGQASLKANYDVTSPTPLFVEG
jgi:hypothetical protein